jgi:pimeloyl-ACP methyl ester carboxylesterase
MRLILPVITMMALIPLVAECQMLTGITYVSSADKSIQPAMFYAPTHANPAPLVVALHTWSGDYGQTYHTEMAQWCMANGWAFIHPNFRGPNNNPSATGSDLVVQDIVDAVEYAKKTTRIDSASVYLVGVSGGGYTALLMAGRHPEIWAGVSAWVPISDLKAWYKDGQYAGDIVKSCGGVPGKSAAVDEEYRKRSPLTYMAKAKGVRLHINAGIQDGHQGSVPISHSLLAFNEVADPKDRISGEDIRYFVEKIDVPPSLKEKLSDPSYGRARPLFRRTSGNATVTIFAGGHQMLPQAAIAWIDQIQKSKKGSSPR